MKRAVICFTRVPRPGVTKTRLLPVLKPEDCARLHWAFLQDLATVYSQVDARLFVAHVADPDWELLKTVFPAAEFLPQEGSDLGEKMYRAIREVLKLGFESVILTGADLPLMTPSHLESGFAALEENDITIGPSTDGGYYLIGMKEPRKEVFRVEGYGGSSVFEKTVAAAGEAGLLVGLAQVCDDVDTPEDLRSLEALADPRSHTGRFLKNHSQEVSEL